MEVLVRGVQDCKQSVVAAHTGNGHSVVDPFRLGHLAEIPAQVLYCFHQALHGAVRIDGGVVQLSKGFRRQRHAAQQAVEDIAQRGPGAGPFHGVVRHQAHHHGHILNAVTQCARNGGRAFECLAHDGDIGVGVCRCRRQHIRKVRGIRRFQPKGGQVVRYNIGYLRQVLPGCCRQVDNAVHAVQHFPCVPACHRHILHSVGALLRGKLGCCAQLLCFRRQRRHFRCVGVGDCLHSGHCLFKVSGHFHALHVGVRD